MATGTRIRQDFIEGTLISNLSTSATAMESDGLVDLTVIDNAGASNYAAAVIGDEVVHIITHQSAATTAAIERGQEGTTAAAHDAGAAWHHGPTEDDFAELAAGGGGATAKASRESTSQSIPSGTATAFIWDTEVWDTDGIVDVGGANPERFTIQTAGKYDLVATMAFDSETGPYDYVGAIWIQRTRGGSTTTLATQDVYNNGTSGSRNLAATVSCIDDADVGDYYEAIVFQTRGSARDTLSGFGPRNSLTIVKFSD